MPENTIDFGKVFSDEAIDAIKGTVLAFLEQQHATNANLEFKDKTVYLHAHRGSVEIHIVDVIDGKREIPDLPSDDIEDDE